MPYSHVNPAADLSLPGEMSSSPQGALSMPIDRSDASSSAAETNSFDAFVVAVEPRLRAALVARHGRDRGAIAAAEALSWAWERWDRVRELESPVPYLVKVGTSRTRTRVLFPRVEHAFSPSDQHFEPGLDAALRGLSDRQRSCVVLIAGFEMSFAETAEILGLAKPTVQKHYERGMKRLRRELGVDGPMAGVADIDGCGSDV
jgi:DNA-directed RNA polymerase specialized sigma24 family protein